MESHRVVFAFALALALVIGGVARAGTPKAYSDDLAKRQHCTSTKWSSITKETQLVHCKDKQKEATYHSVYAYHHADAAPTFEIVELLTGGEEAAAIKGGDADRGVGVKVSKTKVTIRTNGWSGEVDATTWDLAAWPPARASETRGGAFAWSDARAPTFPTCTVDLKTRIDRCTWSRVSCDDPKDEDWTIGTDVTYMPIPSAPDNAPNPFACAATFGKGAATFQAVATLNGDATKVALHLKRSIGTADDHFEIALARVGDANVDWRDDKAKYCAARATDYLVLVVVEANGKATLEVDKAKGPDTTKGLTATLGADGVTVELTSRLAIWATQGGISIALVSPAKKTVATTSPFVVKRPETYGRIGGNALCPLAPTVSSAPWK